MNKRKLMKLSRPSFFHSSFDNFRKRRIKMMSVISSSAFIRYKKSFNINSLLFELQRRGIIYFAIAVILFTIVSVAGVIRSFSQNGAIPIATIPMINKTAANLSFHFASVSNEWSLIAKGPIIAFPTALKIYTAVTTIEAQAMIVAIR